MGITVYSVIISVVFFNIALVAAFIMRRSSVFLAKRTISFLLLMVLLGIVRLLFPIDLDLAYVVRSYYVLPTIEELLKLPLVGSLSVASLLLGIWAAGTAAFLIRDLIAQLRFLRSSRSYPSVDRMDLLDLAGEFGNNYGLLVSPAISRPYVAGLFRPVIYLPDITLPEEQWRLIFRHEVQHIRSHDGWKKLFFLVIQALFWWNPLAHISRGEIDTLIELQCDAKVTAGMSAEEVNRYLETLKSLKASSTANTVPAGAATLVWDQKQLVTRFEALQDAGFSRKRRPHIIAYILLFSVFVLSYFVIVQPARFASEREVIDAESVSYIFEQSLAGIDNSDMYIVHKDGMYYLYVNGEYASTILAENLDNAPFNTLPILEEKNETIN